MKRRNEREKKRKCVKFEKKSEGKIKKKVKKMYRLERKLLEGEEEIVNRRV